MSDKRKNTEIVLIKKKKKKNIIHEVYLYDRTLVKRFIKTAPLPDMRRVWRIEDRALRRLRGLPVPDTYGWVEKRLNGVKEVIYAREYLEGRPIESFSNDDMGSLAAMMVQVHERGVITRDPAIENFIKRDDGKILFIDFGRSVILNPKNPLAIDYMGKELARLWFHAFAGNNELYACFHEKYFELLPCSRPTRFLMEKVSFKWYQFLMGQSWT